MTEDSYPALKLYAAMLESEGRHKEAEVCQRALYLLRKSDHRTVVLQERIAELELQLKKIEARQGQHIVEAE